MCGSGGVGGGGGGLAERDDDHCVGLTSISCHPDLDPAMSTALLHPSGAPTLAPPTQRVGTRHADVARALAMQALPNLISPEVLGQALEGQESDERCECNGRQRMGAWPGAPYLCWRLGLKAGTCRRSPCI